MELFRYTFQNENGDYYYVDGNGDVQISSSLIYLRDDPANWQNTQVSFDRNETKHGVFRKSSVELKFHSKTAKILRFISYTYWSSPYCKLTIYKQNRDFTTNNWDYALWYSCEINFATAKDGSNTNGVKDIFYTAELTELGIYALLEANETTPVEIPIYNNGILDSDAIKVKIDGVRMRSTFEYNPLAGSGSGSFSGSAMPIIFSRFFLQSDTSYEIGSARDQGAQYLYSPYLASIGNTMDSSQFANYMFESNYAAHIQLNYSGEVYLNNNSSSNGQCSLSVRLLIANKDGIVTYSTVIYTSSAINSGTSSQWQYTATSAYLYLNPKDRVFIIHEINNLGSHIEYDISWFGNAPTDIRYYTRLTVDFAFPASYCYGFRGIDLAKKISAKLFDGAPIVSSYLGNHSLALINSKPYNLIYIPTTSLRNLANPIIKTTWDEFKRDLACMYGIGEGVKGDTVYLEPRSSFYKKNIPVISSIPNSELSISLANDWIYGRIKIGYSNDQSDSVNGLQEFCCEHVYSLGITIPSISDKELDLTSPYIHGMYSIENLRSYLFSSETSSTPSDNDVLVIEVEDTPVSGAYKPRIGNLSASPFGVVSGLLFSSDAYNTGHSPKSCLARNMDLIKSMIKDGSSIKLLTVSKNRDMFQGYGNNSFIREDTDLYIDPNTNGVSAVGYPGSYIISERLFLPFSISCSAQLPFNLVEIMEIGDNKYGVIQVDFHGDQIDLFVLDCGITPATEDAYSIRGLLSPNTDPSIFIR